MAMDSDLPSSANGGLNSQSDLDEYTLHYQRIVSGEQRSRYKEDFNAQYNEYRDLHKAIDKVSKRFAQLEEELRQQHEGTVAYKVKFNLYRCDDCLNSLLKNVLFTFEMEMEIAFKRCSPWTGSRRPKVWSVKGLGS